LWSIDRGNGKFSRHDFASRTNGALKNAAMDSIGLNADEFH
jgi:hypothetical protein